VQLLIGNSEHFVWQNLGKIRWLEEYRTINFSFIETCLMWCLKHQTTGDACSGVYTLPHQKTLLNCDFAKEFARANCVVFVVFQLLLLFCDQLQTSLSLSLHKYAHAHTHTHTHQLSIAVRIFRAP
jgi:hypothetical protein